VSHVQALYNAIAKCIRKVRRARRFDRVRAARPLNERMREYWDDSIDALFDYMAETEGWEKLHRHVQVQIAAEEAAVEKALSDEDVRVLVSLLSSFGYFADESERAEAIVKATAFATYEKAAEFALGQIGVRDVQFELRNPKLMENLLDRREAVIFANRSHMDQVFSTITKHFYELGRNPFDKEFLSQLRKDLRYNTTWEAKRFSLTETGITAELAQIETYRQNGVQRKRWNILGANTRPTHEALDGVEVAIDEEFDVGGYPADHPLDPSLPAAELVNCHCWMSPVVDDTYQIDPERVWTGE
jgi:hypothetical protein